MEQKNGSVVHCLVGHHRYSGVVAGQTLAHLYKAARLHVNYFQPSFKLLSKSRVGSKCKRKYEPPATPCERLLRHAEVDEKVVKARLLALRDPLDPLELLHRIREGQSALAKLVSEADWFEGPGKTTLEKFLSELPNLWKAGEVRPTHKKESTKIRYWRTRKDPFEMVWLDILQWLQRDPDTTAKSLFQRLQADHPGRFPDGQLRTLQRRVRDWRQLMAKQLLYTCINGHSETQAIERVRVIGDPGLKELSESLIDSNVDEGHR